MSKKKPNIIITMMDDQRADLFSFLGHPNVQTPHLDRLAAEGTCFTQACNAGANWAAVCAPARGMLHTGRGFWDFERNGSFPDDWKTLGECLQDVGYHTHGIGKWHNTASSYQRSFKTGDEIFIGGMGDPWNATLCHYHEDGVYDRPIPFCPKPGYSNELKYRIHCDHIYPGRHASEIFADAAVDFLRSYEGDEPYMLYVAFTAPHDPCTAPPEWHDKYKAEDMELPENYLPVHPFDNGELAIRDEELLPYPRTASAVRKHLADYYAMMAHADDQIGRIHAALKARGDAENTIIVHTGDHGLAVGSHGLMGKQNIYQHSLQIPMILSGPGIPKGTLDDRLCYGMDVHNTLLEAVGACNDNAKDSQSLFGEAREELYFSYCEWQQAWTDGSWKVIEYKVDGHVRFQLFNLKDDPKEITDLSTKGEYAEQLQRALTSLENAKSKRPQFVKPKD